MVDILILKCSHQESVFSNDEHSIPVSLILGSTCFRRTDCLNMNMIKAKGIYTSTYPWMLSRTRKGFLRVKGHLFRERRLKDRIEARKFMLRSPNHAAISTMISTIVLLRVRSYSESTKVQVALWFRFFCSVLTHSCTFPEVHIEKGNVIVQSIVSLRQLLYVILTMSL